MALILLDGIVNKIVWILTYQLITYFEYLSPDRICWHFITQRSPNFGGMWKTGIWSVKYTFLRIWVRYYALKRRFRIVVLSHHSALTVRILTLLQQDIFSLIVILYHYRTMVSSNSRGSIIINISYSLSNIFGRDDRRNMCPNCIITLHESGIPVSYWKLVKSEISLLSVGGWA